MCQKGLFYQCFSEVEDSESRLANIVSPKCLIIGVRGFLLLEPEFFLILIDLVNFFLHLYFMDATMEYKGIIHKFPFYFWGKHKINSSYHEAGKVMLHYLYRNWDESRLSIESINNLFYEIVSSHTNVLLIDLRCCFTTSWRM